MIAPFFILLMLIYALVASADTISPRAFLGCAQVLQSRIHCFGGATNGPTPSGAFTNPTNDHFYMDLQNFNFNNVSSGANNWTMVTGSTGANLLVANSYHLTGTIMNKSKFIVYGGLGPGDQTTLLDDPFWAYDATNNSWSAIPVYGQYTVQGAMVDIGALQGVWTWGGKINNTNWYAQNQKFTYNYGVSKWDITNGDPVNQNIKISYTATLGNDGVIYMLGGLEVLGLTNDRAPSPVDMLRPQWYDTKKLTWGIDVAVVGSTTQAISSRTYHTSTLIPGTSSFLVYGGNLFANDKNQVQSDYAYLYDYAKKLYTPLTFDNKTGAGKRSGHAAIVYNTDIFIMFGYNDKFQLLNDIHALDVSNIANITWRTAGISDTTDPASPPTSTSDPSVAKNGDDAPVLSSGAIAGIAIGAAIVLVGIGGSVLFFFYRKRQQQKQQFQIDDPRQHPHAADYMLPTTFPDHQTVSTSHHDTQTKVDEEDQHHHLYTDNTTPTTTTRLKPTSDERELTSKPHGDE